MLATTLQILTVGVFPFRRLLNHHAKMAYENAKALRWIQDDLFIEDYFELSDVSSLPNDDDDDDDDIYEFVPKLPSVKLEPGKSNSKAILPNSKVAALPVPELFKVGDKVNVKWKDQLFYKYQK